MHQNFYQFDFELPNREESEKLIALLSEKGFDGFEEDEDSLIAFAPVLEFDQVAFEKVLEKFSIVAYTQTEIENVNWNQQWEDNFEPVRVGNFVAVRAHFHLPIQHVQHEIIITPKMSFGTGHHATTWLMLQQMEQLDFTGKKVLDFGTGTGILAILAEKLGAASVHATDNDDWSIANATENIQKNHCRVVKIRQVSGVIGAGKFDIILANINMNVILASLPRLAEISMPGTALLFSGLLKENEALMRPAIEKAGFQCLDTSYRGDWICIKAKKS